jgi:hypothetical protein
VADIVVALARLEHPLRVRGLCPSHVFPGAHFPKIFGTQRLNVFATQKPQLRASRFVQRHNVQRIDRMRNTVVINYDHRLRMQRDEVSLQNSQFATIGQLQRKRPKPVLQPVLDFLNDHRLTLRQKADTFKHQRARLSPTPVLSRS